jgi:Na+-transporting NADH:ubiquinone oxidoreductase subunit C
LREPNTAWDLRGVDVVAEATGWLSLRRWPRESASRAILVTLLVCTVCSALIAVTVTTLEPYREANRAAERALRVQEIVASVPGLADILGPGHAEGLESRWVHLETGAYADAADLGDYDPRRAARAHETSIRLPAERDIAGIVRRAHYANVFRVTDQGRTRLLILPVHGAGYVSTLYGYVALDSDLNTIRALTFYEHGETPGLGSEIDNPHWREQWSGKSVRDPSGTLRIEVARGPQSQDPDLARYQVDGISGATRTGAGVTNLLRFWLGPDGFGPYLARLRAEAGAS